MKRLIIVLAALAMGLAAYAGNFSGNSENPGIAYTTKEYNHKNFTGISVSSIVSVELKKSDTWGVNVNLPEELVEYLVVGVKDNNLVIGFKTIPMKVQKHLRDWKVTANISMPILTNLEMSGATKFSTSDAFDIGERTFTMELSGAAKATGINITARGLKMEMGGATGADVTGLFDDVNIAMGGASKCDFNVSAIKLKQELSGAAKAYHTGDFNYVTLGASGAGVFSIKGMVNKMNIDASGAVKVETYDAEISDATVSFSGAAYGELNVLKTLAVELSGGASVRYKDNDGLDLDIISIGRGASLKRVAN